jgi:Flp pilus assembly protein TadD
MTVAYPTDFQILDLSGLCLFALDRYAEAARYLERANQADPSDLETLDILGKAYLRMKDYKALTSVFARVMKLNPNSAPAHIMMGTAYDQIPAANKSAVARLLLWARRRIETRPEQYRRQPEHASRNYPEQYRHLHE